MMMMMVVYQLDRKYTPTDSLAFVICSRLLVACRSLRRNWVVVVVAVVVVVRRRNLVPRVQMQGFACMHVHAWMQKIGLILLTVIAMSCRGDLLPSPTTDPRWMDGWMDGFWIVSDKYKTDGRTVCSVSG
jgi:hypothetical protein